MKSILRRRPSPALVIAIIALFVSLGGVSYGFATGSIDSREIKNNDVRTRDLRNNDIRTRDLRNNEVRGLDLRNSTVQGRDVALNTLTGDDINESRLGKVPSATSADSATQATTAGNAQSVNGLRMLPIKHRSGSVTNVTLFDGGGLQLRLTSCVAGNEEVHASTTVAGGEITVVSDDADAADGTADGISHQEDNDFGPGDDFDLTEAVSAVDNRIYQLDYSGGDGRVVSAHLATESDIAGNICIVSGYAVVS